MAQPRKVHLFNCDNVYQLSIVEDLLNATKARLGFEFSVEKHIFTLSEMSELSTKRIPEDTTKSSIFYNSSFNNIYLFIFLFNVFVGYLYIFLGSLPLHGVYDSFVDYPYDDVVYCH